jgi:glyoxylate reductase
LAGRKNHLSSSRASLPDQVETRMRELFDARLNIDDRPMSQAELVEAMQGSRCAGADRHRPIDAALIEQAGPNLKLIANFGNGVDNIDVAAAKKRHHRHQHAERADRGHRRHDDGADPGRAAPAGRRRQRAARRQMGRLVADLDARPPHLGQAPRHRRHGPHRHGGGAPRQGLRPVDPLPQPPPVAQRIEDELEATYWESLDQMLARMDIISVNCPRRRRRSICCRRAGWR